MPPRRCAMYSVFPTGVTRYEPARAHNSYVLFDGRDGKTHLIDMNGNEVHTWDYIGFPSLLLDPAVTGGQRGHVLVQLAGKRTPGPMLLNNLFNNQEIGELDWDGRSEEHTSELQSLRHLVCRLLLEKKKYNR